MRISLKRLEELAKCLGMEVIKSQEIGGNSYYYYYKIIKNNVTVKGSRKINELMDYLLNSNESKAM